MNYKLFFSKALIAITFFALFNCNNDDDNSTVINRTYGIFTVLNDNKTIEMDGEIGNNSLTNFNKLLNNFPNVDKINIKEVPGSGNDEINLQLSLRVHQKGIQIHLLDNGLIASGGVDFFLAGITRTKGTNTMIGVHSWGGTDNSGNMVTATDFPVGHAHHQPYIDYYKQVGFTQQEAEDFYYFTINAASFNNIHYMTEAEITQYNIIKLN